ncbi:MAG: aromatic amino acid lyase, partial [Longimicrobiales bacterium]
MVDRLVLDGGSLRLEDVERVAGDDAPELELEGAARERVLASRAVVDRAVEEGRVVYGITTGFGALAEVRIPHARIRELQVNLIRSHAAGIGEPLGEAQTRAIV